MTRHVYAYLHEGCGHLASDHRLIGETVAGPYACRVEDCACRIMQSEPLTGLTRRDFEAHQAARPAPVVTPSAEGSEP